MNLPQTDITDAQYDANNRLLRWGGRQFSYDANGNLLADGISTYQWDERGRLKGVSTGATGLANFNYDPANRRNGKTVGSTTTGFVHDGDNFVQELAGTSNTSPLRAQLLTGGIDETFLRIEGSVLQSFLPDGNNNTVRLLDQNGQKLADYSYEPYGKTTSDAANTNSQQYTGRENDNPGNENGLYYYRARYYMPGCARFISEDPIGWASGQTNNYAYVGGDPVGYRDPLGLMGQAPGRGSYPVGQGPGTIPGIGALGAMGDFGRNYGDMRRANTIGADKYFHCKANCEAAKRGKEGRQMACMISDAREWFDQNVKGDSASASSADQAANHYGRSHHPSSNQSCEKICLPYRPNGLPANY